MLGRRPLRRFSGGRVEDSDQPGVHAFFAAAFDMQVVNCLDSGNRSLQYSVHDLSDFPAFGAAIEAWTFANEEKEIARAAIKSMRVMTFHPVFI